MASLFVMTNPVSEIDYSLVDGRVRDFTLLGEKIYSETDGIAAPGWEEKLKDFVISQGLHEGDEHGLHAFVLKMHAFVLKMQIDGV